MANRSWTKILLHKIPEQSFWIGLLISTAYLSYRYPLQINSSTTSPTYSDTPASLQAGKFALIFLTCCISAPFLFLRRLTRLQIGIFVLTIAVFTFPLFKLLYAFDNRYLDISFWPLAALVLVTPLSGIDLRSIDKYLKVVFFFALISDAVQVSLFVLFGRLPALAFSGSLAVRFGGFLDDPNGFGAILFLLMGWSYYRFRGKARFFTQLSIIVCILITQSLTSIGFLGGILLVAVCWHCIKKPILIFPVLLAFAILFALLNAGHVFEIIALLIALKSGSASDHLSIPWSSLIEGWTRWFFAGWQPFDGYESWWVTSLLNFGIVWYIANLFLTSVLVYMVWRSFKFAPPGKEKAVLAGILLFCFYFVAGSANLPFAIIFPINLMFYMFCFLIIFSEPGYKFAAPRAEA